MRSVRGLKATLKRATKKRVTCSATWPQNWLNSDVARFTTGVRTCLLTNKVARAEFFVGGTNAQHRYSTRIAKQFACFLLPVLSYLKRTTTHAFLCKGQVYFLV